MLTLNRKSIEDYYEKEWADVVSTNTLNILIEITCREYHLNKPQMPEFLNIYEKPKLKKLGEI